jgi:hypothetical protein
MRPGTQPAITDSGGFCWVVAELTQSDEPRPAEGASVVPRAARNLFSPDVLEKIAAVIGATTAGLQAFGVVSGGTEAARRNDYELYSLGLTAFAAGVILVAIPHFAGIGGKLGTFLRVLSVLAFVASLLAIVASLGRGSTFDLRPSIEATVTGSGPFVLAGSASSGGLSAYQQLSVRVTQGTDELYTASVGPDATGKATVSYSVKSRA